MVNFPQADRFTMIPNDIIETLAKTYMTPAESKLILAIIRKTIGYHKEIDLISYSQFEKATGLDRRHVGRAIQELVDRNIIETTDAGARRMSEYKVNPNIEKWNLAFRTKTDTIGGVKLTPPGVSNSSKNLTPITVPSDTGLGKSDTTSGANLTPVPVNTKEKQNKVQKKVTKEILKTPYGEFNNVLLTDDEVIKLKEKFNSQFEDKIEYFSGQLASKGYKFKSHYATILTWDRNDNNRGESGRTENKFTSRQLPKVYTRPEEYLAQQQAKANLLQFPKSYTRPKDIKTGNQPECPVST